MIEFTNPRLSAWADFYVIIGSASAALVGLQFVVIVLIADIRRRASTTAISAFGTPTVVHFAGGLLIAGVMSAPWPSLTGTSIALGTGALAGFVNALLVTRHARRQSEYKPVPEDWLWFVIVPCCLYAALAVAALLLPLYAQTALFIIGGVALGLVMIGVRNAWDSITYLVTGGREHGMAGEKTSE